MAVRVLQGDCLQRLRELPGESVHCCVTSPPYWGLRDYGLEPVIWGDGWRGSLGLEPTPDLYIEHLVEVFREVHRVLRPDATVWINIGDCYATGAGRVGDRPGGGRQGERWASSDNKVRRGTGPTTQPNRMPLPGLKPKDLVGIPWRLAFALQADGWWLRSDIVWCLSGGTRLYARTARSEGPMFLKDLVRLDPASVELWNGCRWTRVLGWSPSPRPEHPLEIELRSGERIGCTPEHRWPTQRGLLSAAELVVGDVLASCRLPEPAELPRVGLPDEHVGWFVGAYLANGSRSSRTIQIASHRRKTQRIDNLRTVARMYDGTCAVHQTTDNGCTINLHGRILDGIVGAYVGGRSAYDKHLRPRCWRRSNAFLRAVLDGYLEGDAHHDSGNRRWRLGFCANDQLATDLRTLCARTGASIRLRRCRHRYGDRRFPGWRGEVRLERSGHKNEKRDTEIVAIRHSRARKFWDVSVADEPHLFALASGVLTHNSKPNPMPESVTDRPTKAHEYVFLLTKSKRYFFDQEAVRQPHEMTPQRRPHGHARRRPGPLMPEHKWSGTARDEPGVDGNPAGRNIRTVWNIATQPFPDAHFAVFPENLIRPCILAGTSERGCCNRCGAPWTRVSKRTFVPQCDVSRAKLAKASNKGLDPSNGWGETPRGTTTSTTAGWAPSCACADSDPVRCTVLDPFAGSGTTGLVADQLGRDAILLELNPGYCEMAKRRIEAAAPLLAKVQTT